MAQAIYKGRVRDFGVWPSKGIIQGPGMSVTYNLHHYHTLSSTNDTARALAEEGAPSWTVVLADTQTAGRGRFDRKFHSPADTGLYMSVILRPSLRPCQALKITTAAAVSVAEALEQLFTCKAEIKWVNDVFVNGKKVCGILTESRLEGNCLSYAVLGIGVNLTVPEGGFPEEIASIAGAVSPHALNLGKMRIKLLEGILEAFYPRYEALRLEPATFFEEYKTRLCCLHQTVNMIEPTGAVRVVTPVDLEPDFSLVVKGENGLLEKVSAGEISLRMS